MPASDGHQICIPAIPSLATLSISVIHGSLGFKNGRFLLKIAETVDTLFDQILQDSVRRFAQK
jgi:hypothetical protein